MTFFAQKHSIAGQRFGRLLVQEHIGHGKWICLCDCGKTGTYVAYNLVKKITQSCGCIRKEIGLRSKDIAAQRRKKTISHDELKQNLKYDPLTGLFTWLVSPRFSVPIGCVVGSQMPEHDYLSVGIKGKSYKASHLAWFYMHGSWPRGVIDHLNGNTKDNSIANLRDCSRAVNSQNQRRPHSRNSTGFLGVTKTGSPLNPFRAQINVGGKITYIGIFETAELAHDAYLTRKRMVHEGCTI